MSKESNYNTFILRFCNINQSTSGLYCTPNFIIYVPFFIIFKWFAFTIDSVESFLCLFVFKILLNFKVCQRWARYRNLYPDVVIHFIAFITLMSHNKLPSIFLLKESSKIVILYSHIFILLLHSLFIHSLFHYI